MTTAQAWDEGTNIRVAIRCEPEQTRAAIVTLIKNTCDFIDAKKTLRGIDDIILTAQAIEHNHPTLKLEELALVTRDMKAGKFGKFYERLKTAEFLDCICQHEARRAEHLERTHTRHSITRGLREGQKVIPHETETLAQVIARRHPLNNGNSKNRPKPAPPEPQQPPRHQDGKIPQAGREHPGRPGDA